MVRVWSRKSLQNLEFDVVVIKRLTIVLIFSNLKIWGFVSSIVILGIFSKMVNKKLKLFKISLKKKKKELHKLTKKKITNT